MAEKRKIWRATESGTLEQVLVETSAEQVTVDKADIGITDDSITVNNAQQAFKEIYKVASTGGVTGVKGNAETTYRKGNVNITKANIGLGNVDNTSDANKPVSTAQQTALDAKVDKTTTVNGHALSADVTVTKGDVGLGNVTNDAQVKRSEMGVASGVATLGTDGKVPTSQLPSYVDDVLEFANRSGFPATGETGKIYVAKDTNLTYRWGGSAYVEISASLALGETSSTAYAGDKGKANADAIANLPNVYQTIVDSGLAGIATDNKVVTAIKNVNTKAGNNADEITKIKDGTTKVKDSEHADSADEATHAGSADSATTATKLSATKTFAVTGAVTGSTTSDLSGNVSIATTIPDNSIESKKLKTLLTAGGATAVKYNAQGQITEGLLSFEFGKANQTTPSPSLIVNGIFFELQ